MNCVVEKLKAHQMMQNLERQQAGKDYIDNDMVFCNEFGGYVTPNTITKRYKKLLQRHGIRHVKFHGLRHAFATRALEGGMNMKVVQELMGHSTMATTANVYTHVSLAEKRKAMACLEKNNNIG